MMSTPTTVVTDFIKSVQLSSELLAQNLHHTVIEAGYQLTASSWQILVPITFRDRDGFSGFIDYEIETQAIHNHLIMHNAIHGYRPLVNIVFDPENLDEATVHAANAYFAAQVARLDEREGNRRRRIFHYCGAETPLIPRTNKSRRGTVVALTHYIPKECFRRRDAKFYTFAFKKSPLQPFRNDYCGILSSNDRFTTHQYRGLNAWYKTHEDDSITKFRVPMYHLPGRILGTTLNWCPRLLTRDVHVARIMDNPLAMPTLHRPRGLIRVVNPEAVERPVGRWIADNELAPPLAIMVPHPPVETNEYRRRLPGLRAGLEAVDVSSEMRVTSFLVDTEEKPLVEDHLKHIEGLFGEHSKLLSTIDEIMSHLLKAMLDWTVDEVKLSRGESTAHNIRHSGNVTSLTKEDRDIIFTIAAAKSVSSKQNIADMLNYTARPNLISLKKCRMANYMAEYSGVPFDPHLKKAWNHAIQGDSFKSMAHRWASKAAWKQWMTDKLNRGAHRMMCITPPPGQLARLWSGFRQGS